VTADRDQIHRELLAAARERLADDSGEDGQAQAFWSFGDALDAAGLAAALGEDEAEVRELLGRAAREAVDVFALRGTHVSEIREAPGGTEEFVDTSATSPGTLVRALHSAAAAGDDDALEQLAGLDPEDYHSEQVVAGTVLESLAAVLQHAAAGGDDLAERAREALEGWGEGDAGQRPLLAQLRALERLGEGDQDGFEEALDAVAEADGAYQRSAGRNDADAKIALGLPVRGLRALADRRGR
jgi:hypothetical protein